MQKRNEKNLEVDMENVALPEVHVRHEAKESVDDSDSFIEIDYSGAIPVYHPQKKIEHDL